MSRLFDPAKAGILESDDRLTWNNPREIVEAAQIAPGSRVAEIGCGSGWFTFEIERAARPRGLVYALDTQTAMLQNLETKRRNYERILTIPCGENEFELDDGEADAVFHANVLHECSDPIAHLSEARRVLKNGGRIIVIEWRPEADENLPGPKMDFRLAPATTQKLLAQSGFEIGETSEAGPYHYAVFATKK